MPPSDLFQKGSNTHLERFGSSSADGHQEPRVAKALAGGVRRLGDAVGV
jgi:hypothetical protein